VDFDFFSLHPQNTCAAAAVAAALVGLDRLERVSCASPLQIPLRSRRAPLPPLFLVDLNCSFLRVPKAFSNRPGFDSRFTERFSFPKKVSVVSGFGGPQEALWLTPDLDCYRTCPALFSRRRVDTTHLHLCVLRLDGSYCALSSFTPPALRARIF